MPPEHTEVQAQGFILVAKGKYQSFQQIMCNHALQYLPAEQSWLTKNQVMNGT
jgi:hypothetical protein